MEEEIERLMEKSESELSIEEKQKLHNYWYERECKYCKLRGSCQQLNLFGCEIFDEHAEEPIVDEDELNDWLAEVDTDGFMASVSIDEWCDEEETHPKTITITLSYKTGDGVDQPYSDEPPDDYIIKGLEEAGWETDTEGVMKYGLYCPKCKTHIEYGEAKWSEKRVAYLCPKCRSELTEIEGSKWIYGYKTLKLKGDETAEQIKDLIEQAINEVI